ncbi:MAG: hypothetical protein MUF34_31965 [Polyangiaceae bacterium]|nr:hypothetical protein [Polyangiaceae bacterium]
MVKSFFACMMFGAALLGCAPTGAPGAPPAEGESETQAPLSGQATGLIQPGANLLLLEVTGDDHAIYQDGEFVYATALKPGAKRELVAQVPPGNTAFVYVVGNVAFCWTNPDRSVPGFGVSPLVVWSAAHGAHEASAESPIGTFATSASEDGSEVLFPTNAKAGGTVGDIEIASADFRDRRTLLGALPMGFPQGRCRPFAAFVGGRGHSHPVALHCEGDTSTATLSSWEGDERTDLLGGVATPPFFTADPGGDAFFTTLAGSGFPVAVTGGGEATVLDEVRSRLGFFAKDGFVVYTAQTPAGVELRRVAPGPCPEPRTLAGGVARVLTVLAGSKVITERWTSPDGRRVPFATQIDPATGLANLALVDARAASAPLTVDPQARNGLGGSPFSADSKHLLFVRFDVNTGASTITAFGEGGERQLSDVNGWSYRPAQGGFVSFNDNAQVGPNGFTVVAADLKVVDLSRKAPEIRLIAPAANPTYFSSHERRRVVFTTDRPGTTAGLYSANVKG